MAELVLMTLLPRWVLHSWSVSRRCWSCWSSPIDPMCTFPKYSNVTL